MRQEVKGYLTVYLALVLGVMVTLCLALIEGVRLSTLRLETACISDIATDSIMAEYHRELFRQYNLLAIDTSYGGKTVGKGNTEERLAFYLEKNMSLKGEEEIGFVSEFLYRDFLGMYTERAKLMEFRLLTDFDGEVFRRRAVQAMEDDCGMEAVREVAKWLEVVREYELDTKDIAGQKERIDKQIAAYDGLEIQISEEEWKTLRVSNPTDVLEQRRRSGVIAQTIKGPVSGKRLQEQGLLSTRKRAGRISRGNSTIEEQSVLENLEEWILFQEYLVKYMGCLTEPKEEGALSYQIEYVIMGQSRDEDNLRSVLNRLLAMREAANCAYLMADQEKMKLAELFATGLSAVLLVPELKDLFQISIVLGWAYAESIYDLRVLVNGGRVPLLKEDRTWHFGLQNIWQDDFFLPQPELHKEGLSYPDYLRVFLLLTNREELTLRAMNVVESDIRLTPGNEAFRLDACMDRFSAEIQVNNKRDYRIRIVENKQY